MYRLRKRELKNGRFLEHWYDADTMMLKIVEVDPPESLKRHIRHLEDLRDNRKERARKADGLVLAATFTPVERSILHAKGINAGDMEGLDWALKQEEFRHCRVTDGKLDRG